jgi:hypothetical protein
VTFVFVLLVALVAAVAAYLFVVRRPGLRRLVGERVVLQTRDDRSIRGVLTGVYADCVAVSHFEYLNEAQATGLPGEATVRFDNLSWVHKLGPGD